MSNKLGLVMRRNSRSDVEANRTDDVRFQLPEDYTTEESLQYFQDTFNRNLFREYFFENGTFSNDTMLAFADVSTPAFVLERKVGKPIKLIFEFHRQKYLKIAVDYYHLDIEIFCELYHRTLVDMAVNVKSGAIPLEHKKILTKTFEEQIKLNMSKSVKDK